MAEILASKTVSSSGNFFSEFWAENHYFSLKQHAFSRFLRYIFVLYFLSRLFFLLLPFFIFEEWVEWTHFTKLQQGLNRSVDISFLCRELLFCGGFYIRILGIHSSLLRLFSAVFFQLLNRLYDSTAFTFNGVSLPSDFPLFWLGSKLWICSKPLAFVFLLVLAVLA